jgi:hypothetical protein
MKRLQLIAITEVQGCIPKGMRAVEAGDLAAIYAPLPRSGRLTRRRMLRAAAQRQACLESLLPSGAVLPVLPGHEVPLAEAVRMLRANAKTLNRRLAEVRGRKQYQITLAIDESNALSWLARPNGPFSAATNLQDLKRRLVAHLQDSIDRCGGDRIALPVVDGLVCNFVVLVDEKAEAALQQKISDMDALWSGGFRFRLIGPSPAVSFASVGFRKTSRAEFARALDVLKLPASVDASALAKARAAALRDGRAPVEEVRLAAGIIASANELQEDNGFPFHRVFFWAEGEASTEAVTFREAA